ncbi:WD repeat-containing protein 36 [Leptopilina heterotoma]|uniref:WD repeat-containing protein 36 n=1 Tax=Leptopilina heterotoma TaxID=63436 RepID=UPI001CA86F7F|nr:WD repeat-containing protein 36 [Leptopilina heterotoma]
MSQSKIFCRNRALGYVSNEVPHVTRYIQNRKENLIVTCVGKSFHTYGFTHFTLLSVSGTHPGDITCMAADTYHVYTASENEIFAWRRGNELVHNYKGHESTVHCLLPFGPHLLSVDEDSNVKVWDIKSETSIVELNFSNRSFKITKMMHPATYMNKILFASEQGELQLWNIKTLKMIYKFQGWNSAVTALEQAPAVHVAAIGLASGKIILHNLEVDESIFELIQDWGLVTSITFRSDGYEIMATGSLSGHIVLWNLNTKKVESQILNAHFGAVTGLNCLPNEPLIISTSPDNSLKLWIFDQDDGGARLLRIREGFAKPPTYLRFHGNDGDNVVTSGEDSSLRIFSTLTETFNKSLGRASYHRKSSQKKNRSVEDPLIMPYITEFSMEKTREKEWDDIAAVHYETGVVTTWSYDKLKMGQHKLLPEDFKHKHSICATTVYLTHCGNFVIIGYNNGCVERFNIQSGIHRASYGVDGAHTGSIMGVTADNLNQFVITAGKDALLKFWPFKPLKGPLAKLELNHPVEFLRKHDESSLLAVALQDFSVIIVDFNARRIVRKFEGHMSIITDATFSPDARWLITASRDSTIRTWDIPSSQAIDIFQVPKACISLDFSPNGEYLATVHVDYLGIFLWVNRTIFTPVSLKAINSEAPVPIVPLPGMDELQPNSEQNIMEVENDVDDEYKSPEQISNELITLSSLAQSRWKNLLDIDIIKKRNKPKEPPKAPEAAPFFLPTIPSLEPKFDFSDVTTSKESNKIEMHSDFQNLTIFSKFLLSTNENNNFLTAFEKLMSMGPSGIDFEIQSLSHNPSCSVELMFQFMKMIQNVLESRKYFELTQAFLGLFLKTHGEELTENKKLYDCLCELQQVQEKTWIELQTQLFDIQSVVAHLKKV